MITPSVSTALICQSDQTIGIADLQPAYRAQRVMKIFCNYGVSMVSQNELQRQKVDSIYDNAKKGITTFLVSSRDYGMQITVAGCLELKTATEKSNDNAFIRLNNQNIPIADVDSTQETAASCIVLFENPRKPGIITSGKMCSDVSAALETMKMDS